MTAWLSVVILLLVGVCGPANGQVSPPVAAGQPPSVPVTERHRNPDYVAPDATPTDRRRPANRPEIRGGYAVPFGPEQVSDLVRYRASGISFSISGDGRWLILSHRSEESDDDPAGRQPPFRPGLFGGPRLRDPFSSIR